MRQGTNDNDEQSTQQDKQKPPFPWGGKGGWISNKQGHRSSIDNSLNNNLNNNSNNNNDDDGNDDYDYDVCFKPSECRTLAIKWPAPDFCIHTPAQPKTPWNNFCNYDQQKSLEGILPWTLTSLFLYKSKLSSWIKTLQIKGRLLQSWRAKCSLLAAHTRLMRVGCAIPLPLILRLKNSNCSWI